MDQKRHGILYQVTSYLKEKKKEIARNGLFFGMMNLYFGFLCATHVLLEDLLYLDGVYLMVFLGMGIWDFSRWYQLKKAWREDQTEKDKLLRERTGKTIYEILKKERESYEQIIYEQAQEIEDVTDYMTKWAHEAKLPLCALRLMNERNEDLILQRDMENSLERLMQLLNTMMMSSKLRNLENDVEMEKVYLFDAVKESLKNLSYFLIQENFQIEQKINDIFVYSDRRWLVYLLDQLLANAVKYRSSQPVLTFQAEKISKEQTVFSVSDNGIGILKEEIPYIFDRGFIGSNLRDGDYRSTGMGLYFVKKMAKRLGIEIGIDSDIGRGTTVKLYFSDNSRFFYL